MMDRNRYGKEKLLYSGMDRANSRVGYRPGNCIPCCRECNMLKGNQLSVTEMVAVIKFLRKLRRR